MQLLGNEKKLAAALEADLQEKKMELEVKKQQDEIIEADISEMKEKIEKTDKEVAEMEANRMQFKVFEENCLVTIKEYDNAIKSLQEQNEALKKKNFELLTDREKKFQLEIHDLLKEHQETMKELSEELEVKGK